MSQSTQHHELEECQNTQHHALVLDPYKIKRMIFQSIFLWKIILSILYGCGREEVKRNKGHSNPLSTGLNLKLVRLQKFIASIWYADHRTKFVPKFKPEI